MDSVAVEEDGRKPEARCWCLEVKVEEEEEEEDAIAEALSSKLCVNGLVTVRPFSSRTRAVF